MFFKYFVAFILTSQYHQYFLYVMIIWYNSGISNFHHSKPHYGSLYLPSFLYPGIFTIFAVSYTVNDQLSARGAYLKINFLRGRLFEPGRLIEPGR